MKKYKREISVERSVVYYHFFGRHNMVVTDVKSCLHVYCIYNIRNCEHDFLLALAILSLVGKIDMLKPDIDNITIVQILSS